MFSDSPFLANISNSLISNYKNPVAYVGAIAFYKGLDIVFTNLPESVHQQFFIQDLSRMLRLDTASSMSLVAQGIAIFLLDAKIYPITKDMAQEDIEEMEIYKTLLASLLGSFLVTGFSAYRNALAWEAKALEDIRSKSTNN